ncbi:MAG: hypothetical protein UT66_C0018G0029 [candidate division CPR2 bacterium GW2011_GWC1_39_9]|uniref:General stress protein B n=1 Tax=candidate division CPR2 bacterium GW2011_GWC2_39_10 TaxID=1618345 RepID=A0A0G0LPX6_UNCC2|nr:MAG: hypothetical protein UT18_C0013G0005 [candidate division CPR2 bacterium GW2011_GWC2_39_10]KKR34690.1 MAG: hypothetical protein UT66_C0018G0029 [candidate division CPR2 bacterium GW2011_GWC1_39_9]
MEKEEERKMTVEEAGRKGGEKTAQTHDREFYEEIGKKGGDATRDTHGHEFYEEIGQKGGQKVKDLIERGKEEEEKEMY